MFADATTAAHAAHRDAREAEFNDRISTLVDAAATGVDDGRLKELAFMCWLVNQGGYRDVKPLVGRPGYWAGIMRLAFHFSIMGGRIGDEANVQLRYCYEQDYPATKAALDAWDGTGEPTGWVKDAMTGRCRPGGDPARERMGWSD